MCDLLLADSLAETGVRQHGPSIHRPRGGEPPARRSSSLGRGGSLYVIGCSADCDRSLHPWVDRADVGQGGSGGSRDLGADRLPGEEQEGVTRLIESRPADVHNRVEPAGEVGVERRETGRALKHLVWSGVSGERVP